MGSSCTLGYHITPPVAGRSRWAITSSTLCAQDYQDSSRWHVEHSHLYCRTRSVVFYQDTHQSCSHSVP